MDISFDGTIMYIDQCMENRIGSRKNKFTTSYYKSNIFSDCITRVCIPVISFKYIEKKLIPVWQQEN